jgi:hypothetical protein
MVLAIAAQPALTQAGQKAKAQALLSYQSRMVSDGEIDFDRMIAASLARDLIRSIV